MYRDPRELEASSETSEQRWLRRVFVWLAVLYMLPLLATPYMPSLDGPSHTYNAWILRQLDDTAQYPLFARHYEANLRPYPNWAGHAVMTALMYAVPPVAAEKLLAMGYVLLFVGAVWYLVRSVRPAEDPWPALLAFPFAYNRFFAWGFYNFSLGVAAALFTIGFWWRHRRQPGPRSAVVTNLLLLACWFCHLFCFAMALFAISVLWLATLRRDGWRRHLLHLPLLAPQLLLPIWFFRVQGGGPEAVQSTFAELLANIARPTMLHAYSAFQLTLASVLAGVLLVLVALTLRSTLSARRTEERRRDESWAFLVLAGAILVLYFGGLESIARGSLVTSRASLFAYLVLIAWLAPGLRGRGRQAGIAALVLIAVVNVGYLTQWYGKLGEDVRRFVAGLEPIPPDTRMISLIFERYAFAQVVDVVSHATAYAAIAKGVVDWDNYEAKEPHFPVRFRSEVELPRIAGVHTEPGSYRPMANRETVDAVYTWKMPRRHPLRRRLRISGYERRSALYGGELFVREDLPRPSATDQ